MLSESGGGTRETISYSEGNPSCPHSRDGQLRSRHHAASRESRPAPGEGATVKCTEKLTPNDLRSIGVTLSILFKRPSADGRCCPWRAAMRPAITPTVRRSLGSQSRVGVLQPGAPRASLKGMTTGCRPTPRRCRCSLRSRHRHLPQVCIRRHR
jgi:hypothetical protein